MKILIKAFASDESAMNNQYFAPKSGSRVIKINDYCQEDLNEKELNRQELDNESTLKFLAAPRFIQVINTYSANDDRVLFEAEYINLYGINQT